MDNLAGLRDIHLPEGGVSFWPLAGGWWLLIVLIIGMSFLYYIGRQIRRISARFYARRILLSLKDDVELPAAVKMSEILRRACVRKYPEAVALSGDEWIAFLNQKSKHPLNARSALLLKDAPFVMPDTCSFNAQDMQKLWQFCYDWVGDNL